jgi:hypothetical protein
MALLNYNLLITGDCQNSSSGVLELFPNGGSNSIYTVEWYSPNLGVDTTVPYGDSSIRTGLSAGTYQILITDSTTFPNEQLYVNLFVSSGICLTTSSINTTCNDSNGILIVTATTLNSPVSYNLYSLTNGFVTSASTGNGSQIFNNLSADTYYVECFDNGGCSGSTATCIIKSSDTFDYGFFVIEDSNCLGHTGKLYITGQTGTPPYTYLWANNGETTSSISGLTAGTYSVTVTDSSGCVKSKTGVISNVNKIGIVSFVLSQPGCFQSNGQITAVLSGGSAPYYCVLSNGDSVVTYSTNPTFSGLTTGTYTLNITDSGLCTASGTTSLSTPNTFALLGVNTNSTTCGINDGSINVSVIGGATPYTYTLTDSLGNIRTSASTSPSLTFIGLSAGVYQVGITNPSSCSYQTTATVQDNSQYRFTATSVNTSCNLNNGQIILTVDTPGSYSYQINGQQLNTTNTSVTFSGLNAGLYTVTIRNQNGCVQTTQLSVGSSTNLNVILTNTGCGNGSDGTINALITGGVSPLTLNWSPNVNGQTGVYVYGLTAGTYSLSVTDALGCSAKTQTIISCSSRNTSYELFNVCKDVFTDTPSSKLGFSQMLNQGYYELTKGNINCVLNSANFIILLNVGGTAYTSNFYTTTSLLNYPTDQEYVDALTTLLDTVPNMGSIIANLNSNLLNLNTDCTFVLGDKEVTIKVEVDYDICCENFPDCLFVSFETKDTKETEILFTTYAIINGYPAWQGTINSCTITIFFNDVNNRWETSGLVPPCAKGNVFRYGNPIGSWVDNSGFLVFNTIPENSGNCVLLTPTPTPSITPTKTPTPTPTPTPTTTPTQTRPPCLVQVSLSGTNPTYGVSDGSITATTTGNYGAVTYLWSPGGQTTRVISGLNPGLYTVTVTDTSLPNCTASTSYSLYESFILKVADLNSVRLHLVDTTSAYTMSWGDGTSTNYPSGVSTSLIHTYTGSAFSGDVKLLSYNLGSVRRLYTDLGIGTGGTNASMLITGSELSKLTGMTLLSNVNSTFTGYTYQIPRTMQTFYSLKGKLRGNINNLPNTLKSLTLGGYETNDISGNTANFPSGMTYVYINGGTNTINGDIKDIPSGMTYFGVWGNNTISGNTVNIPSGITAFYLYGFNTLVGDISNIPISGTGFIAYGHNSLSGNILSLSAHTLLRSLGVANRDSSPTGNTIGGDINNIPKKLDYLELRGNNTIYGNIINMPTGSTSIGTSQYFNLTGLNTVSGQASDISVHVTDFFLAGQNKLSGNTSQFPSNIKVLWVGGLNALTGDIANLPPNAWNIQLTGTHTIKDYTPGRSWAPNMNVLKITPAFSATNFLTTTEVDNLMNDLTGTTWSVSTRFGNPQITLIGTASTASQLARTKLSGSTPTGYGVSLNLL